MYAVDALGDAIDVTRDFLTSVGAGGWVKLAIVVFFLTGLGIGLPSVPTGEVQLEFDDGSFEDPATGEAVDLDITSEELVTILLVLAAIGITIWLLVSLVGSILEFSFVASLASGEVHVRRYGKRHLRQGLSLFGFRLAVDVLSVAIVAIPAYVALAPIESIEDLSLGSLGIFIALVPLVYLTRSVIDRLTTEFVVPVMITTDRGVIGAWRRFWPALRGNLGEYVVYVLLATVIWFVASIAISIAWIVGSVLLVIAFVLLVFGSLFLGPLGIPLVVFLVVTLIAAILLWLSILQLPVVSYIRYYALLVLGDTDSELDLVPDQRTAVRSAAGWDDDARGDRRSDSDDGWGVEDDSWSDSDDGWGVEDDSWSDSDDGRTGNDDGRDDTDDSRTGNDDSWGDADDGWNVEYEDDGEDEENEDDGWRW